MALFSRTFANDELIALCSDGIAETETGLLAHYELEDVVSGEDIADASGNGNNLEYINRWIQMDTIPADYAYSMAVVGDTQIIARDYPEELDTLYDWIIDNKDSKKIEYVIGVGDITDDNTAAEWTAAQAAISQMDGILPYSLVRGNHDTAENLNKYFANENYMRDTMGFYAEGDINNSYDVLTVGDDKYLLLNLNYSLDADVVAWIDDVLTEYADHKVIVSLHSFICSHDGGLLTRNHACNPSMQNVPYDSTELWDQVFSQYENIFMILCGHEASDDIMMRQDVGVHGNTVTQLLMNPQYVDAYWKPSGMVAMLYFYPEKNEIAVEYYSTIQQCYFKESNRYTISLPETETAEHGDATGDGKINPLDVVTLSRYLAGWTDYTDGDKKPVLNALDLNGDGMVTLDDATVLARHIAQWIGYEELPYKLQK